MPRVAHPYAKLAADIHTNRKIRKAGRLAREVYIFALCRNRLRDQNGVVPHDDLDPWYLADQLLMPEPEAIAGLEACFRERLLESTDHGIEIVGWEDEWGMAPKTEAERKSTQRDKAAKRLAAVTKPSGHVTRLSGQVTHLSGQPLPLSGHDSRCPDSHGGEERRGDQDKNARPGELEQITRDPTVQGTTPTPTEPGTPERAPVSLRVVPDPDPSETTTPGSNVAQNAGREPHEQAVTLAALLMGLVCENNPTSRIATSPEGKRGRTMLLWAADIEKLHDVEHKEWGTIHAMIEWCQRDPFWRSTVLGGAALRDKWDTMQAQKTHRVPNGKKPPTKPHKNTPTPTTVPRGTGELQTLGKLAANALAVIDGKGADPATLLDEPISAQDDPT